MTAQTEARKRTRLADRYWKVEGWLYGGDRDTEVTHRRYSVVRIRVPQMCSGGYHTLASPPEHPVGTLMVCERAVVDGRWGSSYTCPLCIATAEVELADRS